MSYKNCVISLGLGDRIAQQELRETAAEYERTHQLDPEAAMLRAVTEKLAMAHMEEKKIIQTVRSAYEAQGGPKRAVKAEPVVTKPAHARDGSAPKPAEEVTPSKRWEYPVSMGNKTTHDGQIAVVDHMNGDITKEVLIERLGALDLYEGVIRSVTNRDENFREGDVKKVIAIQQKRGFNLDDQVFNDPAKPKGEPKRERKTVTPDQSQAYADALAAGNKRHALRVLHEAMGIEDTDASIDRGGLHSPAGPEGGSPMYDVARETYPEDVYSHKGLQYYGTGSDRMDAEAYRLIREVEARPNATVTIYRAVDHEPTNAEQIAKLEKDMATYLKRRVLPDGMGGKSGFEGESEWVAKTNKRLAELKAMPEESKAERVSINPGDWVTTVRAYAKEHGDSNIKGGYKIISKKVAARDIFTSGDSWLEWGYHPQEFKPEIPKGERKNTPLEDRVNPPDKDDGQTEFHDRAEREAIRDAAKSRAVSAAIARAASLETDPIRRTSALLKLRQAFDRLESGSEGEHGKDRFVARVENLLERLEQKTADKSADKLLAERARGADIIREKLLAAKRRGDITPETADMADWFIRQNPELVSELGLSLRTFKGEGNAPAGQYNPAARVMTLFKEHANDTTGVHEILHHMERLMPRDMQAAIRGEYIQRISKLLDNPKTTPEAKAFLQAALKGYATGEARDQQLAGDLLDKAPADFYQYFNPSEFWAVNSTRLMARRYQAQDSIWSRIHGWMSDAVQKVKGAVGLRSDAPILRALDTVLRGESGKIERGTRMLSDARDLNQPDENKTVEVDGMRRPTINSEGKPIAETPEQQRAFWRWFGDSKVVFSGDLPAPMYHGTSHAGFESFDTYASDYGLMGMGGYFTSHPKVASGYTNKGKGGSPGVYKAYLSIKNPIDMDAKADPAAWQKQFDGIEQYHEGADTNESWYRAAEEMMADEDLPKWEGAEAMQDGLRAMGFDGITHIGGGRVKDGSIKHRVYIAFDPEQIKSATGNNGEFDPSNPSILYDRSRPDEPDQPGERKDYHGPGSELLHATTDAADGLLNNLLENVSPLTLGSDRARAIAFDFAAARRKAQYQWGKLDQKLTKDFTAEERKNMWEAADEQNELMIRSEDTAGKGIDRLPPDQRAALDYMSEYGNVLLEHAREVGMFKGEGVPYWTPRMAVRLAANGDVSRVSGGGPKDIGGKSGIATTASSLKARQHEFLSDSEAALKMKMGEDASYLRDIRTMPLAMEALERAIAGRTLINKIKAAGREAGEELVATGKGTDPEFFTIKDNPAFFTSEPRMLKDHGGKPILDDAGKVQMVKDQNGNLVFDRVPIYIRKEFQGPLEAVMIQKNGDIYKGLMGVKGAAMSAVMWTPFTHMMTEIGRAAPLLRTRMLPVWFVGNKAKNNLQVMSRAIDAGLVPIGGGHGFSDITGMVGDADLQPGRSWATRKVGNAIGKVNHSAGEGFKKGADAFGKFWHDKLLWDRIGDLQMGIYTYYRADLMKKGRSEAAASVQAAHFANRYAGAIKPESVPGMTGKILNVLMFSRSFTLGNLGAMKDCLTGLPKDVKSKILMDAMSARLALGQDKAAAKSGADKELAKSVSSSRFKSIEAMAVDLAVMVAVTSLAQSGMNALQGLNPDEKSFLDRMKALKDKTIKSPLSVANSPLDALWSLSSSHTNEPNKEGRILIGYDKDGTAEYARLAFGKIGEEVEGYLSHPVDKLKSKMSTLAKPMLETVTDDKGFGRPLFDPDAKGVKGAAVHIGNFATNLMKAQIPADTIQAAYDWTQGNANEVDKLKVGLSLFGIPVSKGATGGPEVGVVRDQEKRIRDSKAYNMPMINRALKEGDEDKAREIMDKIGMTPHEQNSKINAYGKVHNGPTGAQIRSFGKHATTEEQEKMDTVR